MRTVLRTYNPAMTSGDAEPAYSLEYSLKADDLRDLYATDDKLRTRRAWIACLLAFSTSAAIVLINLGVQGVWSPRSGAGRLFTPATFMLVALAITAGRHTWRLAPSRLARLSWKTAPNLRGQHRDDIRPDGVSVTSPDGTRTFVPWSVIVSIRETKRAFVLRDRKGQARVCLPKRGLPDPALLPALGAYLREAARTRTPACGPAGSPAQG